ncbi:MAG: ATP-binding protein [Oligoflexales bacterium]
MSIVKKNDLAEPQQTKVYSTATGLHITHEIVVQLERSKRASENLVYNLPELVLIIDENTRILKANRVVEKLLDVNSGDLIYSKLSRFFSPHNWKNFRRYIEKLDLDSKLTTVSFDLATDGLNIQVKHYHWNIRRIVGLSNRRGPLYYIIGHDITEIRLMLEEIKESHSSLEKHSVELENLLQKVQKQKVQIIESSKLAQLGEMAGGIAHEINNPITIIKGHAEHLQYVLEKKPIEASVLKRSTSVITATVDRVAAIVKSMRSLAKDGSADPFESCDIIEIMLDSIEFLREKCKLKRIDLRLDYKDQRIDVECRGVQISQIFINLIGNAIDAIEMLESPWIEISVKNRDKKVVFYITDSGPRIKDEIANKIMQPFFTTKQIGSGTGLGLSITRSIIEQHGGSFWLDRENQTTRFVLELPKKQKN